MEAAAQDKPTWNPLILMAVAAPLAAVRVVYQLFVQPHLNPLQVARLVVLLLFIVLYIAKSRFAWHVLAFALLVIWPAYLIVPQIRSQFVRPNTDPVLILLSLICVVYLWRVRRPYFRFVERGATPDI